MRIGTWDLIYGNYFAAALPYRGTAELERIYKQPTKLQDVLLQIAHYLRLHKKKKSFVAL